LYDNLSIPERGLEYSCEDPAQYFRSNTTWLNRGDTIGWWWLDWR